MLEPIPTFSTCYSAPFIVCHPSRYASMLAERMKATNASCWLVNTGWVGGKYGTGNRCPLKYTRAIIDAIHGGTLASADTQYHNFGVFGLSIPTKVPGVPDKVLDPAQAWDDKEAFNKEVRKLAAMFQRAFKTFDADVKDEVKAAGPTL